MTDRLDALTVREKDGKSYWTRIGVAFPAREGPGWTLFLDAMPASNEGQYKIVLRLPLPKRDAPTGAPAYLPPSNAPGPDDPMPDF